MALGNMRGRRGGFRGGRGFRGRGGPGVPGVRNFGGPVRGGPGVRNFGGPGAAIPSRRALGVDTYTRPSSYKIAKSFKRTKDNAWRHDLYEISGAADEGAKLFVSNLDFGVSNQDIKELFSEIGDLVRFGVHYDSHGRPNGTAEVVFVRRSDAMAAMKRYNNVTLDGRPMKIEIIGSNPGLPVSARLNVVANSNSPDGRPKRTVFITPKVGGGRGGGPFRPTSNRGGFRRGRGGFQRGGRATMAGRGRGGGRDGGRGSGGRGVWRRVEKKSVQDLDKDLDNYHAKAETQMDTS